ncbi:MAG: B12-binding domain-containing radical SAM protein [bacterium]
MRLLFIQLPRLDPDITSPGENLMPAAACLRAALECSPEAKHWEILETPACQDTSADAALADHIAALCPDALSATCYLWNIERTLHLLKLLKKRLPALKVVIGGPDIAANHPLLPGLSDARRSTLDARFPADACVIGEGETVFPAVLRFFRTSRAPGYRGVSWRTEEGTFIEGSRKRPVKPLQDLLPVPDHPINRPDAFGMAYLETNRGCPMRCAFCCYNLRRSTTTCLPPEEVATRIRILRERGAKEIRLVDPTFNAHPRFDEIIEVMTRVNGDRAIAFFVELRADTLTDDQARRLAEAGVAEAEVGIQSTDPKVLKLLHRPLDAGRVLRGIEALLRHGIKPTLDFMYGLPAQDEKDIQRSLDWLARFGDAIHPQFLPTLLLPGTELRDRAKDLGLRAQRLPPYRVQSTDILSARQLAKIESWASERLGGFDSPTQRFVGVRLPDLFSNRMRYSLDSRLPTLDSRTLELANFRTSPSSNRQALLFSGPALFFQREAIAALIRRCVLSEPHILWQFVLEPTEEEPLDLFDFLIAAFNKLPGHWLDRLVAPPGQKRLCARRLFVKLPRGKPFDPFWTDEVEALLSARFH